MTSLWARELLESQPYQTIRREEGMEPDSFPNSVLSVPTDFYVYSLDNSRICDTLVSTDTFHFCNYEKAVVTLKLTERMVVTGHRYHSEDSEVNH